LSWEKQLAADERRCFVKETGYGCTAAIHPLDRLANAGGALNIREYLRLSAAKRRF
jgi:hypothetical protein